MELAESGLNHKGICNFRRCGSTSVFNVVKTVEMASTERLDGLRERNKDLLHQLKLQREELERLCGCSQSCKREREHGAEERRDPAEIRILTDGDRGPARAALAKPRFAGNETVCIMHWRSPH